MKHCARCGNTKPKTEFYSNVSRGDGLQSQCKDCCEPASTQKRMTTTLVKTLRASDGCMVLRVTPVKYGWKPARWWRVWMIEYPDKPPLFISGPCVNRKAKSPDQLKAGYLADVVPSLPVDLFL